MATVEFSIRADHPALAGHFPGNPIVPGVVLLDEIIAIVETEMSSSTHRWQVLHVPVVKFLRPVLPAQLCVLEFSRSSEGRIKFTCRSQGEAVATGELRGDPESTSGDTR